MTVRTWPVFGVVLAILWLFVRGVDVAFEPMLAQFLIGLAVGLPLAFVFRRLYADRLDVRHVVRAVPAAVRYILAFLREIAVANVDVAYRVLAPGSTVEPEVILIPLRVQTSLGITTIANSITVTPGTLAFDHDPELNALYVHVIDGRNVDKVVEPIRRWEDYALVIFDEELSPEDPATDVAITGGEIDE